MVATIVERNSIVYDCKCEGKLCLHRFIKTRVNQPNICLNCLRELNIRDEYKVVELGTLYKIML